MPPFRLLVVVITCVAAAGHTDTPRVTGPAPAGGGVAQADGGACLARSLRALSHRTKVCTAVAV
jgi:hypothetical protein